MCMVWEWSRYVSARSVSEVGGGYSIQRTSAWHENVAARAQGLDLLLVTLTLAETL